MSLFAREKWAIGRCPDAARLRRSRGATRHDDRIRRGDAGFGLIEVVVSLALLAIVIVPITRIILTTESASNSLHLRAEAADLATQALETAQYQTANGVNPTAGVTITTQFSGGDRFKTAVDFELAAGTGTSSNICIAPPGQLSSQIWTVKATVRWGKGSQKGDVIETTLISPSQVDVADTNAAEIAVPVFNANESGYETTAPISLTVTGTCTLGPGNCGTVPSNEVTTESANSGSSGCAVFPGLFAGAGETYSITASSTSPYVDPNELFYLNASSVQFWSGISPPPNQVTVVSNPHLVLAQGAATTVNFQTVNFGSVVPPTSDPSVSPAPYIPISVQSASLLCSITDTCVLGNGNAAEGLATAETVLLFPGPTVTGATPNYSAWAGDAADSSPTNGDYGSTVLPTSFQGLSNTSLAITLPVYPLTLTVTDVTGSGGAGTVSQLQVIDSGGGDTMKLNGTTGTVATGLPLGQYEIEAVDTGNETVSSGASTPNSPVYVWITPTGVCTKVDAPLTDPCATPSTSPIAVTVG